MFYINVDNVVNGGIMHWIIGPQNPSKRNRRQGQGTHVAGATVSLGK